jgi:hypothetical protein
VPTDKQNETKFLNVDLDIQCMSGLEFLLNFLNPHVCVIGKDEKNASIELNTPYRSLDETLQRFAELIKSPPQHGANIWNQCEKRVFNIGIQGGMEPHEAYFFLSHKTISLLTSIQAEVQITVYAQTESS